MPRNRAYLDRERWARDHADTIFDAKVLGESIAGLSRLYQVPRSWVRQADALGYLRAKRQNDPRAKGWH